VEEVEELVVLPPLPLLHPLPPEPISTHQYKPDKPVGVINFNIRKSGGGKEKLT
jgi:hypothetical protein